MLIEMAEISKGLIMVDVGPNEHLRKASGSSGCDCCMGLLPAAGAWSSSFFGVKSPPLSCPAHSQGSTEGKQHMSNDTSIPPGVGPGTAVALHGLGWMINSLVCLLHDRVCSRRTELGDYLHAQAGKHPEGGKGDQAAITGIDARSPVQIPHRHTFSVGRAACVCEPSAGLLLDLMPLAESA
jgi:hypothetical protein